MRLEQQLALGHEAQEAFVVDGSALEAQRTRFRAR
jgi:hypothetical protein